MTFIACLLVTRLVYPSDNRRAAGSTTAMQILLRAISRGYEPMTSSFAPGGAAMRVTRRAIGSPWSRIDRRIFDRHVWCGESSKYSRAGWLAALKTHLHAKHQPKLMYT
jgi:hypothetical protein